MLDLDRRVWVEATPKSRASWEAKARLRRAKHEPGRRKDPERDRAAWVLTAEPD